MTRYNLTTVLTLVLLIVLAPARILHGQANSTKLIDDFNDGNDDGWASLDFLQILGLGETIFDASTNAYTIRSVDEVVPITAGCGASGSFWEPSTKGARDKHRYSNGTVRATLRFDNDISNGYVGMRYDPETISLYDFFANNSIDVIGIGRITNAQTVDLVAAPFELATGQDYIVEATAVGPQLSIKIWKTGDDEPAEPQLFVMDDAFTSGELGLVSYYCAGDSGDIMSTSFDDVTFTPGNSAFGADRSSVKGVPEPAGFVVMCMGIVALGLMRRRSNAWRTVFDA